MTVSRGQAFLIPSGTEKEPDKKHLHIVCTDPCAKGNVLLVSITSWKNPLCDDSCILDAGDHEFIKKKSWVMYRNAQIVPKAEVESSALSGTYIKKADVSPPLLDRICSGLLESPAAKRKIKTYLRANSGF